MTQNTAPYVLIIRQVLDVMRRECWGRVEETGGLLLGVRSEDGTLLITHATPPGPGAMHRVASFRRDVPFQQRLLDDLFARHGVNYLGEWHRHPAGFPVPSEGDRHGVTAILRNPEYGVDFMLFPIVECDRRHGFRIHMFGAALDDDGVRFQPVALRELDLQLDPDRAFVVPPDALFAKSRD